MILYQYMGGDRLRSISAPCLKVEMGLCLAGADYETKYLRSQAAARKVSRTGRLPVLEIGDERIVDSVLILDRIEADFPDAGLSPADPQQKVRDRLWEHFATDSLYWAGFYLRWVHPEVRESFLKALLGGASLPVRWLARRLVVPRQVARCTIQGTGGKTPEEVDGALDRGMEMAETGLAGGPFLQGRDRPARGDLALASLLVQAGFRDSLTEMRDRILARPALVAHVGRVFDACGMKRTRWIATDG